MDVSIVIVNYKTRELIADCLESLLKQTFGVTYEVIVVDNNSGDGCREYLLDAFAGRLPLQVIELDENVGFGRANNAGFKVASGRNIFCLNPDTVVLNNAVKILSDYLDNNPGCGACGANIFNADLQPSLSHRRILPGIGWEMNELLHLWPDKIRFGKNRKFNHTSEPMKVGYITGADLMMPRKVVESTRGFDPRFFMYWEDTDLCARIHRMKLDVVNVPEARIQHLDGKSFAQQGINLRKIEIFHKGRRIYYENNASPLKRRLVDFIYNSFLLSRLLLTRSEYYKAVWKINKELATK